MNKRDILYHYWAEHFQVPIADFCISDDLNIVDILCGEGEMNPANVFEWDGRQSVIFNKELYEKYIEYEFPVNTTRPEFIKFLEDIGAFLYPPSKIFYWLNDKPPILNIPNDIVIKKLDPKEDKAAFKEMEQACSGSDLYAGWVQLDHSIVFGAYMGSKMVCFASAGLIEEPVSDIGIVTHPSFRKRGFGSAVIASLCDEIFKYQKIPQYRVEPQHECSAKVVEKMGFQQMVKWWPIVK